MIPAVTANIHNPKAEHYIKYRFHHIFYMVILLK